MNGRQGDPPTLQAVRALVGERRLEEAQTLAERLIVDRPDDAEGRFILGIVQAERGKFADALINIRHALAVDPNPPWNRLLALANVLRDSGDATGAETVARQLIVREPTRVQALNALGLALQDQQRLDEAIAVFRQASTIEPAYIAAHLNLASALEASGD